MSKSISLLKFVSVMAHKKSIRFFNDRQVRAVWDEEHSKWWFSAIDIVRAINDEDDYKKCRNYWKYLKGKMAKEGVELVSIANHFKFEAPDGKQRASDALDTQSVQTLARSAPRISAKAVLPLPTHCISRRYWRPSSECPILPSTKLSTNMWR